MDKETATHVYKLQTNCKLISVCVFTVTSGTQSSLCVSVSIERVVQTVCSQTGCHVWRYTCWASMNGGELFVNIYWKPISTSYLYSM